MKRATNYTTNMVLLVAQLYKEMALSAMTLLPARSEKIGSPARATAEGLFAH